LLWFEVALREVLVKTTYGGRGGGEIGFMINNVVSAFALKVMSFLTTNFIIL